MKQDNVIEIRNPDPKFRDYLTEILQSGCRRIIAEALEEELNDFLDSYRELKGALTRDEINLVESSLEADLCINPGTVKSSMKRGAR